MHESASCWLASPKFARSILAGPRWGRLATFVAEPNKSVPTAVCVCWEESRARKPASQTLGSRRPRIFRLAPLLRPGRVREAAGASAGGGLRSSVKCVCSRAFRDISTRSFRRSCARPRAHTHNETARELAPILVRARGARSSRAPVTDQPAAATRT
jgi:hypothetical protein